MERSKASEQILRQRKIFIYKNFGISDGMIFRNKKEGIFREILDFGTQPKYNFRICEANSKKSLLFIL